MVPFVMPIVGKMAAEVASWPKRPKRVLDIAAGHGLFGITLAQAIPDLEVTALDWPAVLTVARENATTANVAERYHTLEGSAFDLEWGTGYDLVLLANFLHHFDRDTCVGLLTRAKSALNPGGRALAVEFVPNDDRVSPPLPAAFAYVMLASTSAGNAFTLKELQGMGFAAGFSSVTGKAAEPTPETFVTFEP
jgi:ubiquinone/menaquinone biosynthesis C-methylase UbiE